MVRPTFSLKAVVDVEEMGRCLGRVTTSLESSSNLQNVAGLTSLATILEDPVFRLLVSVHNTIQRVQCFQCPPPALCTDARDLVQVIIIITVITIIITVIITIIITIIIIFSGMHGRPPAQPLTRGG